MRLVLIRHGLTDYNLKKIYCGFKDIALNRIGKAQAKVIKNKLKGLRVDRVFCSDLKRSWQSAEIIFSNNQCAIVKNPNLREINFGEWEGLNFEQIIKRYPSIYKNWLKDPFTVDIPAGEKMGHFITRIRKELKKIIKENMHKTVAIVGHFGPLRIILNDSLRIKRNNFWQVTIEPQAVYLIEYKSFLKPRVYIL